MVRHFCSTICYYISLVSKNSNLESSSTLKICQSLVACLLVLGHGFGHKCAWLVSLHRPIYSISSLKTSFIYFLLLHSLILTLYILLNYSVRSSVPPIQFNPIRFVLFKPSCLVSLGQLLSAPVGPILERMQLCRVHGECAALRESLVTVRTGVRLFAGVCAYVFREIVLHAEGLLTVATMKWFFTCKTNKTQILPILALTLRLHRLQFSGCRAVPKLCLI